MYPLLGPLIWRLYGCFLSALTLGKGSLVLLSSDLFSVTCECEAETCGGAWFGGGDAWFSGSNACSDAPFGACGIWLGGEDTWLGDAFRCDTDKTTADITAKIVAKTGLATQFVSGFKVVTATGVTFWLICTCPTMPSKVADVSIVSNDTFCPTLSRHHGSGDNSFLGEACTALCTTAETKTLSLRMFFKFQHDFATKRFFWSIAWCNPISDKLYSFVQ